MSGKKTMNELTLLWWWFFVVVVLFLLLVYCLLLQLEDKLGRSGNF